MNDEGASEVLGTILLIGITLAVATVFALALFSTEGPRDHQYSELSYKLTAGPDGVWNTGDEQLRVRHAGGESFETSETTIRLTIGATPITVEGGSLDQGFADGSFEIGETWTYTLTAAQNETIEARTIIPGQLHSEWKNGVTTSAAGGGSCSPDTTPPILSGLAISPADVSAQTSGTVDVTISASDACNLSFVNLTYDVGSGPTTIPMTSGTPWTATIPDQGWGSLGGETLEIDILATDASGNTASASLSEPIEVFSVGDPFLDNNCDDVYGVDDTLLDNGELDDGEYNGNNDCLVLPAGWGPQSRDDWDLDVGSVRIEVDLTATDDDIEIRTRQGDLHMEGVTLDASDRVRLRAEEALSAAGATITGADIDIDEDGSSTTMDFSNATLTATGGSNKHINIRNDGLRININDATITGNGDITVRAETDLDAARSTLAAGDDITIIGFTGIDVQSAEHTAVDNLVMQTNLLESALVEDYCGLDDNNLIPLSGGLPVGSTRGGCGVVV